MVEQLFNITAIEGVVLFVSVIALIQFCIYRISLSQLLNKQNQAQFPGLVTALADIPHRADPKAKRRKI